MKLGVILALVAFWALIISHDLVLGILFLIASVYVFVDLLFDRLGAVDDLSDEDCYEKEFDSEFNQASFGPDFPVDAEDGHVHFLQKDPSDVQVFIFGNGDWKRVDDTPYKA